MEAQAGRLTLSTSFATHPIRGRRCGQCYDDVDAGDEADYDVGDDSDVDVVACVEHDEDDDADDDDDDDDDDYDDDCGDGVDGNDAGAG